MSFHLDLACRFDSRVTIETVIDVLGDTLAQPVDLSLDERGFKDFGIPSAPPCPALFAGVVSLSLADNELSTFGALALLPKLRVLCLNRNRITKLEEGFDFD